MNKPHGLNGLTTIKKKLPLGAAFFYYDSHAS